MTKSAREVIAGMFCEAVSGSCANADEMASYYAAKTIVELSQAGYVILPKDLVEKAVREGMSGCASAEGDRYFGPPPALEELYAMISHAEGEKG